MEIQVASSARRTERGNSAVVRTLFCVCVLICLLPQGFAERTHSQTKPSVRTSERFRFRVTGSEDDLPIPGAAVALVYWRKKGSTEEKKEMEVKSDKNGIAEFPKVDAEKIAVSVTASGYRPCWYWIRSNRSESLIRVRLEKWARTPK